MGMLEKTKWTLINKMRVKLLEVDSTFPKLKETQPNLYVSLQVPTISLKLVSLKELDKSINHLKNYGGWR